jgi:hypothetical protein
VSLRADALRLDVVEVHEGGLGTARARSRLDRHRANLHTRMAQADPTGGRTDGIQDRGCAIAVCPPYWVPPTDHRMCDGAPVGVTVTSTVP